MLPRELGEKRLSEFVQGFHGISVVTEEQQKRLGLCREVQKYQMVAWKKYSAV
jgi:hypothetical protein